jgi:hypothetical protein
VIGRGYYAEVEVERKERLPTADYETLTVVSSVKDTNVATPLEQALVELSLGRSSDDEPYHRRPPRVYLDRPVRFRTLESGESVIGAVKNLSVGGAFIRAPRVPSPGILLALGFYVSHEGRRRPMCSMGKVVWISSERAGFGLQFIQPPRTMVQTIDAMIQDQLEQARADIPPPDRR